DGLAKKDKPVYGLSHRELAAYCALKKIGNILDECSMALGVLPLHYKEMLIRLKTESPGTKQYFYWDFLEKQRRKDTSHITMSDKERALLHPCAPCGQPTTAEVCSYCKLMVRAKTSSAS